MKLATLALASLGAYLLWQWVKGASLRDEPLPVFDDVDWLNQSWREWWERAA
jgi:hypothetical protein